MDDAQHGALCDPPLHTFQEVGPGGLCASKGSCYFQMGHLPPGLLVCPEWKNLSLADITLCEAVLPPVTEPIVSIQLRK